MGSALIEIFTDFAETTNFRVLTGPERMLNEAAKRSYLLGKLLKGNDAKIIIQAGSKIRDYLMFDEQTTRQAYQTGAETFTWANPQVVEHWEYDWRFHVDHLSYTENEIELQAGDSGNPKEVFKRIMRIKEMRLETSSINGMEADLWRAPIVSEMQGPTAKQWNSIPLFVTEATTGLFDPFSSAPFTDVGGLSPVTEPKWDNQRATYDENTPAAGADWTGFQAFDQLFYTTRVAQLPTREQYSERPSWPNCIVTSRKGMNLYQRNCRLANDTFAATSRQDPAFPYVNYAGIELYYVQQLDTAALYENDASDGLAAADAAGALILGPRYYWLNTEHLKLVLHSRKFMQRGKAMHHPNQPFTWVIPTDTYANLICSSRQRQGIISPSTNLTDIS
ncbi:MAG TPA: phage major capsid protein [Methylomirabilota bacterium]